MGVLRKPAEIETHVVGLTEEVKSVQIAGCPYCHAKPCPTIVMDVADPTPVYLLLGIFCDHCQRTLHNGTGWTPEVWAQGV